MNRLLAVVSSGRRCAYQLGADQQRSNAKSLCYFRGADALITTAHLPQRIRCSPRRFIAVTAIPQRIRCFKESNIHNRSLMLLRSFSDSSNTNNPASFDWSDDDDDGGAKKENKATEGGDVALEKKLPPPYDPFSKKPVVEEPRDPSDLQEIFHKMRTEGLTNAAIKMFDALSKDGRTHEALELFSVIKDKGAMPDVVAHTAVIEAYANAGGHSKEAIRTFDRMLASGVAPNAYTYAVLVRGLARDNKLHDSRRYLMEMMRKGMQPNAATYVAVFQAHVKEQRMDDARTLLEEMRRVHGFLPDEDAVREQLAGTPAHLYRSLIKLLF